MTFSWNVSFLFFCIRSELIPNVFLLGAALTGVGGGGAVVTGAEVWKGVAVTGAEGGRGAAITGVEGGRGAAITGVLTRLHIQQMNLPPRNAGISVNRRAVT